MCRECEYFRRRARDERKAAISSTHPAAKQSHTDLAEAYERKARALTARECRSALRLIDERTPWCRRQRVNGSPDGSFPDS